jgi:hypothetical protein
MGDIVLAGVPAYTWWYGCSPTSGGMIIGYYDGNGYPDLIPGDASTMTDDVKNAIASVGDGTYTSGTGPSPGDTPATPGTGHIGDYALYDYVDDYGEPTPYQDLSELDPAAAHPDDSLADFMQTSRSVLGLTMGGSFDPYIGEGLVDYFDWADGGTYAGQAEMEYVYYGSTFTLSTLASEIEAGRPVLVGVDSNGDGTPDHSSVAIGYNLLTRTYAVLNTWDTTVNWYSFSGVGVPFGISDAVLFTVT